MNFKEICVSDFRFFDFWLFYGLFWKKNRKNDQKKSKNDRKMAKNKKIKILIDNSLDNYPKITMSKN